MAETIRDFIVLLSQLILILIIVSVVFSPEGILESVFAFSTYAEPITLLNHLSSAITTVSYAPGEATSSVRTSGVPYIIKIFEDEGRYYLSINFTLAEQETNIKYEPIEPIPIISDCKITEQKLVLTKGIIQEITVKKVMDNGDCLVYIISEKVPYDFNVTVFPESGFVLNGSSTTAVVTVTRIDIKISPGPIELSALGEPPGVTITFSKNNLEPDFDSKMTIFVDPTTVPGTYYIRIMGESERLVRTAVYTLEVSQLYYTVVLNTEVDVINFPLTGVEVNISDDIKYSKEQSSTISNAVYGLIPGLYYVDVENMFVSREFSHFRDYDCENSGEILDTDENPYWFNIINDHRNITAYYRDLTQIRNLEFDNVTGILSGSLIDEEFNPIEIVRDKYQICGAPPIQAFVNRDVRLEYLDRCSGSWVPIGWATSSYTDKRKLYDNFDDGDYKDWWVTAGTWDATSGELSSSGVGIETIFTKTWSFWNSSSANNNLEVSVRLTSGNNVSIKIFEEADESFYAFVADTVSGLQIIDVSDPTDPVIVEGVDTIGSSYEIFVVGSYAYVADTFSGLQIADVSDPTSPVIVGGVDTIGNAYDVYVEGSYAYVAAGISGLQVVDISDPTDPVIVNGVAMPSSAWDVYVEGSYAYVADSGSGLQIVDVSDPLNPVIVGDVDTPDNAVGIFVEGSYAYVADGRSGLQIIDISDPTDPVIVNAVDTPDFAFKVDVEGSYAYVADSGSGLQIVDVSDPLNPVIVNSVAALGFSYDVDVHDNYAYVGSGVPGLQIVDVSDPLNPVIVGDADTPSFAIGVFVLKTTSNEYYLQTDDSYNNLHLWVNGINVESVPLSGINPNEWNIWRLRQNETYLEVYMNNEKLMRYYGAPLMENGKLQLITSDTEARFDNVTIYDGSWSYDLGCICSMEKLRAVYIPADWYYNFTSSEIDIDPTICPCKLTVNSQVDVGVKPLPDIEVDVGDGITYEIFTEITSGPFAIAEFFLTSTSLPIHNITVDETKDESLYAYVASTTAGLQVIDVPYPTFPSMIGIVDTPDTSYDVFVEGSYAYVASTISGLQVIDVSDPLNPVIVGDIDTPSNAYEVYVDGSYAYVAAGLSGLQVIDVSDPTDPVIVGDVVTPSSARDVYVDGTYAYIAAVGSGLQVIDVSDPTDPVIVGDADTPNIALGVDVEGSYAYVADSTSGLQIIDISDPTDPVIVNAVDTPDIALKVDVEGSYAYVADGGSGLQIIDISDPLNPVIVNDVATPDDAYSVYVYDDYAYVGASLSGLQVINVSDPFSPSIVASVPTPTIAVGVFVAKTTLATPREFSHYWDQDCDASNIGYYEDNESNPYWFSICRDKNITAQYKAFTKITDFSFDFAVSPIISGFLLDEYSNPLIEEGGMRPVCEDPLTPSTPVPVDRNVSLEYYRCYFGTCDWYYIDDAESSVVDGSWSLNWGCECNATKLRTNFTPIDWYYMPSSRETDIICPCLLTVISQIEVFSPPFSVLPGVEVDIDGDIRYTDASGIATYYLFPGSHNIEVSEGNTTLFYDGGEDWTHDVDCPADCPWDICNSVDGSNDGDDSVQSVADGIQGPAVGSYYIAVWDLDTPVDYLIKSVDTSECSNVYVDFYVSTGISLENNEQAQMAVSSDGFSWTKIYDSKGVDVPNDNEEDGNWHFHSININDYKSSTTYIKLYGRPTWTRPNNEWHHWDDFKIICEKGPLSHFWDQDCSEFNPPPNEWWFDTESNPYSFNMYDREKNITAQYKAFTKITDAAGTEGTFDYDDGSKTISGYLLDDIDNPILAGPGNKHPVCEDPATINNVPINRNVSLEYYDGSWNLIGVVNSLADGSWSQGWDWAMFPGATKIRASYKPVNENWYYVGSSAELSLYRVIVYTALDVSGMPAVPNVQVTLAGETKLTDASGMAEFLVDVGTYMLTIENPLGTRWHSHFWDHNCSEINYYDGWYLDTLGVPIFGVYRFDMYEDKNGREITVFYKTFTKITDAAGTEGIFDYDYTTISGYLLDEFDNSLLSDFSRHDVCDGLVSGSWNRDITLEYSMDDGATWNPIDTITVPTGDGSWSYNWNCVGGSNRIRARYISDFDIRDWYYEFSSAEIPIDCTGYLDVWAYNTFLGNIPVGAEVAIGLGDVDWDGDVDNDDLWFFDMNNPNNCWGAFLGEPLWDLDCDMNCDNFIDNRDSMQVQNNLGDTIPIYTTDFTASVEPGTYRLRAKYRDQMRCNLNVDANVGETTTVEFYFESCDGFSALDCTVPPLENPVDERLWGDNVCGRTDAKIDCNDEYDSHSVCTPLAGDMVCTLTEPTINNYLVSDSFILLGDSFFIDFSGNCPANFPGKCLIECRVIHPDGHYIELDTWDEDGNAILPSVTCDMKGDYVVDYCVIDTDFYANRGWGDADQSDTIVTCGDCIPGTDNICHSNYPDGSFDAACSSMHWSGNAVNGVCAASEVCKENSCEYVDADLTSYDLPGGETFALSDTITVDYTTENTGDIAWTFLSESPIRTSDNSWRYLGDYDTLGVGASITSSVSYVIDCNDPTGGWRAWFWLYTDRSASGGWITDPLASGEDFDVVECLDDNDCQICTGAGAFCTASNICCSCDSWTDGNCYQEASPVCPSGRRRQTRTCTPAACDAESRCIADSACCGSGDEVCVPSQPFCQGVVGGTTVALDGCTGATPVCCDP